MNTNDYILRMEQDIKSLQIRVGELEREFSYLHVTEKDKSKLIKFWSHNWFHVVTCLIGLANFITLCHDLDITYKLPPYLEYLQSQANPNDAPKEQVI